MINFIEKILSYIKTKRQIREKVTNHTVLLADYPRCGIGWIRYMLATALHYNATGMLKKLSNSEMYVYAPTLAAIDEKLKPYYYKEDYYLLKTHHKYYDNFRKAIIIYRDPYPTIKSYYTHILMESGRVPVRCTENITLEETFLVVEMKKYIRIYETWSKQVKKNPKSFFLVRYNDLLHYTKELFEKMLVFLEIDYNNLKQAGHLSDIINMYKKTDISVPRFNKQPPEEAFREKEEIFKKIEKVMTEKTLKKIAPQLVERVDELFTEMELMKVKKGEK